MAPETPSPKYHRGNVRADLIAMALQRLRSHGAATLTLTSLAQAIGVSPPAVYNHFRNREALLAAVAAEGFRVLLAMLRAAVETAERPGDKLDGVRAQLYAVAVAHLRFAADEPALYRLMFRDEIENRQAYPELIDLEDEAFRMIGLIHYPRIDRRKRVQDYPLAFLIWATLHGIACLLSDRQVAFRNERELETIARTAMDRLLP